MNKDYILALDQSTSGTKAILIDRAGALAGRIKPFYVEAL